MGWFSDENADSKARIAKKMAEQLARDKKQAHAKEMKKREEAAKKKKKAQEEANKAKKNKGGDSSWLELTSDQ